MDEIASRYILQVGDQHQLVLVTQGALDEIAGREGLPPDRVLKEFDDVIFQHAQKLVTGREPNELGYKLTAEVVRNQS